MTTRNEADVEEEVEYVPEKNWRERTSPLLFIPGVPKEILSEFMEIKKRFGIDIANLVLFAYKTWGRRVAHVLANNILQFGSFEEVIKYLESKVSLFDVNSRKVLSGLIHMYKYNYYFNELLRIVENHEHTCPGIKILAIAIYHRLAGRGVFYSPDCIVNYAGVHLGCMNRIKSTCKSVVKSIDEYCKDVVTTK